jgi:hemolysin activation/secretion protein
MRYCLLILFLLSPFSMLTQPAAAQEMNAQEKGILIRSITMDGFVLEDKNQFIKLFKPYRGKYLKTSDMDDILQKIQNIYAKEGYQQLVTITYQVNGHRLVFTALMTS